MLGDMLWGAVEPLVYCGCISVASECLFICCSGMDNEEGTAITHIFTYYEFVLVKGNYIFIVT